MGLNVSSGSKSGLQHRATISSHNNLNMHIERHTQRYDLYTCRNRIEQLSHQLLLGTMRKNGRLLLCRSPSCFVFVSIYFPVKVPLHNIIYCRKLYINWLLKLSERKTEAIVMSVRVQLENFGFPPQKKKKGGYTACGKLFSRKLNLCNIFILLVYLPITSLPVITTCSEKRTKLEKRHAHAIHDSPSLPCSCQAKALLFQEPLLFLFFFFS